MLKYDKSLMMATAQRLRHACPEWFFTVGLNLFDDSYFLLVGDETGHRFGVSPRNSLWDEKAFVQRLRSGWG